jgi:hypothetical protein
MPDWLERVKGWVNRITELGLGLVALGIILQILFGTPVQFVTGDIIGNLTDLIGSLGNNGLVGLIALAIILWLFQKRNPG